MTQKNQAELLLSVIIPAHNSAPFIAETLDSVLSQGVENMEIVVMNDGSTDNTGAVVESYVKKHGPEKIIHLKHETPAGPSAARNEAIERARGRLIAFIDADDIWLPNTLQKRIDYLESHPETVLVSADVQNFNSKGVIDESYFKSRKVYQAFKAADYELADLFSFVLNVCLVFTSTVVVRKNCILEVGGFDESLHVGEDKELYFRLARRYKMKIFPEIMLRRRMHSTNLSNNQVVRRMSYLQIVKKIKRLDPEFYAANQERLENWLLQMRKEGSYYLIVEGRYLQAAREQIKSMMHRPDWNALYYIGLSLFAWVVGQKFFVKLKSINASI